MNESLSKQVQVLCCSINSNTIDVIDMFNDKFTPNFNVTLLVKVLLLEMLSLVAHACCVQKIEGCFLLCWGF